MVNAAALMMTERQIVDATAQLRATESEESSTDFFAAIAWSVICEPGDSVAGKLVNHFGAARALELELRRVDAGYYFSEMSSSGEAPAESLAKFERTIEDARQRWSARFTMARVLESCAVMQSRSAWFVTNQSESWPAGLNDLENHAPRGLWGIGEAGRLRQLDKAISFVGSRIASSYGENACVELIGPLIDRGYAIISGGAYGIDAMSHRTTESLGGLTAAMMAGGLDRLYPSGNRELFRKLETAGLILSEMPPGAEPTKWRFLQRNRLIAALGQVTVVVEANPRSGAVSTANRAIELDRPLGAVPGPINSSGSDGCHLLIREGKAELITCAQDILEMVQSGDYGAEVRDLGLGALETRVLDVIGFGVVTLETIRSEAGLTSSEADLGVAGLSLMGLVEQHNAGWRRKQ